MSRPTRAATTTDAWRRCSDALRGQRQRQFDLRTAFARDAGRFDALRAARRRACSPTCRRTAGTPARAALLLDLARECGARGAARRDVRRRADQPHRRPRGAAHGAARAGRRRRWQRGHRRRHRRRARRARAAARLRRARARAGGHAVHRRPQHRHRRLRPRPADGGARARRVRAPEAALPLRLQRRRPRHRAGAAAPRPEDDAGHRRVARRSRRRRRWPTRTSRANGSRPTAAPTSRRTSSASPPTSRPRRSSASRPRSASGTGSAAATRCGARSACRSRSPSAPTASGDFLAGAHAMDEHFRTAPLAHNLPVQLALIDVWYRNFHGFTSRSVAPYHQGLKRLPAYLQQLEMESNGKRVDVDGHAVPFATSPVVWGEPGTNGQHAYFQMLHQGTDVVPVEFIAVKTPAAGHDGAVRRPARQAARQLPRAVAGADAGQGRRRRPRTNRRRRPRARSRARSSPSTAASPATARARRWCWTR